MDSECDLVSESPEIQRARELLKSSAEVLERSRNRPHYTGSWLDDQPRFTREAQEVVGRVQAERAQEREATELRREVAQLRVELAIAKRAGSAGYLTTVMPSAAAGKRK